MPIISVNNIGKKYNISHRQGGYLTLRDALSNAFGHPLRFMKQKAKAMAGLAKKEEFWALKDVSFSVEPGEVVGIIGHNGAGKSTLLKILSQITPPTEGEITINGRVGSLLEVGTGFHPELTGRENIFLNGAILGMTRQEIATKFDQIVEFSGVEKFLDTPVKYYSSGMYVRLAFSVAAHLEPDVLIIDEVLAVGDADFQKKCLGKMDEITKKEGRTILFVSHNMEAIRQLCPRCILLEEGEIKAAGKTEEVIGAYENKERRNKENFWINKNEIEKNEVAHIEKIEILDASKKARTSFLNSEDIFIKFTVFIKEINPYLKFGFDLTKDGFNILRSQQVDSPEPVVIDKEGIFSFICCVPKNFLNVGEYFISPLISLHYIKFLSNNNYPVVGFKVSIDTRHSAFHAGLDRDNHPGAVFPLLTWRIN